MKKEKSHSRAYFVAFVLFLLGSVCAATAIFSLRLVLEQSLDREEAEVLFITATPSPIPQQILVSTVSPLESSQYIGGVGAIIYVTASRVEKLGISYFDGASIVQQVFCDPLPLDGVCVVLRPPLTVSNIASFNIVVWSYGERYFIPVNPTQDFITITLGRRDGIFTFYSPTDY